MRQPAKLLRTPRPGTSLAVACVATFALSACGQEEAAFFSDAPASLQRAADLSLRHVKEEDPALLAGVDGVEVKRVSVDEAGRPHTFLRQTHDGVPVFGGEAIVHLNADGSFRFMTDNLVRGLRVGTDPLLRAQDAIAIAIAESGGADRVSAPPNADLQVLQRHGATHLTWRVQLRHFTDGYRPAMPVVFVDAHSGDSVWSYDALEHVELRDASKETYTANNRSDYRNVDLADSSDSVANDAHVHAGLALDYFFAAHGQASFDGAGALVESYVHYGRNYVNAFWDGAVLTYGDGDGVTSGPLVSLDVVAHELSHGVTDFSADLVYADESGALNEATSDIFAAAVEAQQPGADAVSIWHIGEDIWLSDPNPNDSRGPALRYMDDPALAGDYDYYPTRYIGSSDNGGVHWNSGIANLFFVLLSDGGAHPQGKTTNVVAGIGIQNAADIWYRALTSYMTSSTTFRDARGATVAAAADLNPAFVSSVNDAWDAVGVPAPPAYVVKASEAVDVPAGQTRQYGPFDASGWTAARFVVMGSTGDADLYVKRGSPPSTSSYDCASTSSGSNEACEFDPVTPGAYYVMVHAWTSKRSPTPSVTGATLTVYGADAAPPAPECAVDADCDDQNLCTLDTCNPDNTCSNAAAVCDDGNACTEDSCDPATGSCGVTPLVCDDGDACTDDFCDVAGGCYAVDNGSCPVAKGPGEACATDSECASGNCRRNGRWANTCS